MREGEEKVDFSGSTRSPHFGRHGVVASLPLWSEEYVNVAANSGSFSAVDSKPCLIAFRLEGCASLGQLVKSVPDLSWRSINVNFGVNKGHPSLLE